MLHSELQQFNRPTRVGSDGFVRLIDVMGDDLRVVDAARISYGSDAEEHDDEKNRGLIR